MLDDHYTIKLEDGKYTVINLRGYCKFLRYDDPWHEADISLGHNHVIAALANRVEELEKAIGQVLHGTPRVLGRALDGMDTYQRSGEANSEVQQWQERLRRVLEQKP